MQTRGRFFEESNNRQPSFISACHLIASLFLLLDYAPVALHRCRAIAPLCRKVLASNHKPVCLLLRAADVSSENRMHHPSLGPRTLKARITMRLYEIILEQGCARRTGSAGNTLYRPRIDLEKDLRIFQDLRSDYSGE